MAFEAKINAVKKALEIQSEIVTRHAGVYEKMKMADDDVANFEMFHAMNDLQRSRDDLIDEYCKLVDSYFRLNVKYERKRDAIGTLKNISSASGSPPALLTKLVSDTKTLQTELSKKIGEIMKAIESICDVDPTGDAFNFLHEESERFSMKSGNLSR